MARTKKIRAQHAARVRLWRERDRYRKALTAALWGDPWDDPAWRRKMEALLRQADRISGIRTPGGELELAR